MDRTELFNISNYLLRDAEQDEVYPILTQAKHKRNRRREQSVGLLGLQPARIDEATSANSGYESIYSLEEE